MTVMYYEGSRVPLSCSALHRSHFHRIATYIYYKKGDTLSNIKDIPNEHFDVRVYFVDLKTMNRPARSQRRMLGSIITHRVSLGYLVLKVNNISSCTNGSSDLNRIHTLPKICAKSITPEWLYLGICRASHCYL